jgi:hypothetical protein
MQQTSIGWVEILAVLGTIAATVLCGYIAYWFFSRAIKNIMERQDRQ